MVVNCLRQGIIRLTALRPLRSTRFGRVTETFLRLKETVLWAPLARRIRRVAATVAAAVGYGQVSRSCDSLAPANSTSASLLKAGPSIGSAPFFWLMAFPAPGQIYSLIRFREL